MTTERKGLFKHGDRVRIIANSNHHLFQIGEEVIIKKQVLNLSTNYSYTAKRPKSRSRLDWWYVMENDIELIK